ncbi:MAG: alanine racemase [Actinomycetota bacterium]|nr:alanine racemase [Actinomycetota bacterium]
MLRAVARINLSAVERNCALLAAAASPAALCAVVKADGYGHGAAACARAALAGGASVLAVATADEAASLRAAGIGSRLLVMGALSGEELEIALRAESEVVTWREDFVAEIAAAAAAVGWSASCEPVAVHVKLDSGMGRLGTRHPQAATAVAEAVAAHPALRLVGAMTHLATADDDPQFMRAQLGLFAPWANALRARHQGLVVHAANSAATLRGPESHFDMVRCGIAIYGLDPFHNDPTDWQLEPALSLHSYLAEVKLCEPGQSAGYGRRFVAQAPTAVATLPIGYGDGVRRGLTNNGEVLVGGERYPIVGTVSMDNITVALGPTEHDSPARGAEATLIGEQGRQRILAEAVAARLDTINYEVACGISARVPREYHRDGERVVA